MVQDYQVVNKSVVTTAGGADRSSLHGWLCIGAVKIIYSVVISIVYSNNAVVTNICTWNVFFMCMYVCMVITYSRVWINRVRLPILLVVS